MKKSFSAIVLLFIFATAVMAGSVKYSLIIPQPRIEEIDGFHRVTLDKALVTGEVGDPQLPVWGLNLLLPPGEEAISVSAELGAPVNMGLNYILQPVQQQYPLSYQGPAQPDPPNPEIYEHDAAFPANPVAHFHTDFYRGHGNVAVALNPVTYNPVTGELVYYPNLTVTVSSAPSLRAAGAYSKMLRQDSGTISELSSQVDNPDAVPQYGAMHDPTRDPYFDILLITDQVMVGYWDDYVAWKTKCGYYVAVETVQDIYATYPGVDNAEKVRNCIIDYYQQYNLSFVFLAGDAEIVPYRSLADGGISDIPGDCYFAGLDGTWNDDGDQYWGEPNEADLRMEVGVSRGAVDSRDEIANFVNKQIMYQRVPVVEEVETALMAGEDLYWNVWGSDYKEEVRTGRSSWGFYTAPFPPNFEVGTLYDTPTYSWSAMDELRPLMNQGLLYLNHMGHASWDYMLKFDAYQVTPENFTNNGINHNFYLIYSQGCLCGGFDQDEDCITELFSNLVTGPVAMITNSRYGYGNLNSTQGSSQYYDKQFFDALWGENITLASRTIKDSKEDCIPYIDYQMNRYCFYEINLFCEPTLDLWTAEPQALTPNYATEIFLGANSFQVTVPGVDSARVCLSKDGVIHAVGFTDAGGVCNLMISEPLLSLGPADLYVTAHDFLPHEGTVLVIPPTGPYVVFDSVAVDDPQGNNNGVWDYGETTYLDMTVANVGVAGVDNVTGIISCSDTLVTILANTAFYGNIPQNGIVTVDDAYRVMIDGSVADGTGIPFTLTAQSGPNSWSSYFSLVVCAPDMDFSGFSINDSMGNGNGSLDPGEAAIINVRMQNEGGCYTTLLQVTLTTSDPYLAINTGALALGTVQPGAEATAAFAVQVAANCPQEHAVSFALNYGDAIGYSGGDEFSAVVGDLMYLPTGPDGYGYTAYDPYDLPEAPVYQWMEISADSGGPGTMIPFTRDDQIASFPLPFEFRYYGSNYDSLSISTNGYLCMGVVTTDDYSNSTIPNSDGPAGMIATYWEDLSPQRQNSGKVWQWYDAVNHLYIVEFNHVEQFSPLDNFETFETILYDPDYHTTLSGDGRIKMQYKSMSANSLTEGTVGIENPSETMGLQYFFDGATDVHALPVNDGMCILYTTETIAPALNLTLTPYSPPIVIPPQGGDFQYLAELLNSGTEPAAFDVWVMVTLPDGQEFGPVFARFGVVLNPGDSLSRDMTQSVPATAPAGQYLYKMLGGSYYSGVVYQEDSFDFTKSGVIADGSASWDLIGWDDKGMDRTPLPKAFAFEQNSPNPFNPITTLRFSLPQAGWVQLVIFDLQGREVTRLLDGWREAGNHEILWDARDLPSGLYFCRIQAGNLTAVKKMALVK